MAQKHTTEIIETTQITNEAIAVKIRCCGDSLTDEVLTIWGAHKLSPAELEAHIDRHHDQVAEKHRGLIGGHDHIRSLSSGGQHRKEHASKE